MSTGSDNREYNDDEIQQEVDVTTTSMDSSNESSDELVDVHNQSSNGQLMDKENIPICKYCNKIFANFSNLNHHISAIHLNQSKWVCSQCGKVCSSKSNLKVHLRVHLRVKPYHCRWCSYSCMHHSSIRDHLAKVHPDKSHTPLQPGYIFNSQAVPEPDVFNSKSFNVNNFVSETQTKQKRSSDSPITPEKVKRSRLSREPNQQVKKEVTQTQQPVNIIPQVQPNMSNMFNAYQMARMLPFMYPMHLQYAAAAAAAANGSSPQQQLFNFRPQQNPFSPTSSNNTQFTSSTQYHSSNSFEEQTSGTSLTYSTSSRSSSLSPQGDKQQQAELIVSITKQMKDQESSVDMKIEPTELKFGATSSPREYSSSPKNNLTVDHILSNKSNKSTQTDSMCAHCPFCQSNLSN